ncbi:MAG: prepilin-type N-terminal cleavage/methylation domain-containing protein [Pirellulales bacterium]|nr:prepilin-type N-terminal cleavage/methylation domain-containing protein [Pirellulales bacterium]
MRPTPNIHRGMTLVELLLASSIMLLAVAAITSLSNATQSGATYTNGHTEIVEQARMISARIKRTVEGATSSDKFPGFIIIDFNIDGHRFPDSLIVWHPEGGAVNPDGLPRVNELVVYSAHPIYTNTLVEVTLPGNTQTVPEISDIATWRSELLSALLDSASRQVVLTRQLRSCTTNGEILSETYTPRRRGAIRFESRLRPSAEEMAHYQAGTLDWDEMTWVQSIQSSETGLRQAWLRFEFQLVPKNVDRAEAVPFFGSAALYYHLKRP